MANRGLLSIAFLAALPLGAADLSGTWIAESGNGTPMCLALSQQGQQVTGYIAYENDRKFAEIQSGTRKGDRLEFQVHDMDRGTMPFHFTLTDGKLSGENHASLTKYTPRRNLSFDAGLPVAPSIISKVDPNYSDAARKEKLSGTVRLAVEVLSNGKPGDIQVLYSMGKDLDETAIAAVRQWKFTPPRQDCKPFEKRVTVEVNFRLL
jgi:TonB family protein